jgi:fructokinase
MRELSLMNVISIGEVLWDVVGEAEHLGGAPLNFAVNIACLGHSASMVSAVGNDDRGRRAIARIKALGVNTRYIITDHHHATGHVTVALESNGQPTFTIHRPAAYDAIELTAAQSHELTELNPEWIYFGTLAQTSAVVRETTTRILEAFPKAQRFYDINFRSNCYDRPTVEDLLAQATFAKLNDSEVVMLEDLLACERHAAHASFCRDFAARFGWAGVCITRGSQGCALFMRGEYIESPACVVDVVDCIGAGDAFAAGLIHAISSGFEIRRAADFANRLGALIASRPGATPPWTPQELNTR